MTAQTLATFNISGHIIPTFEGLYSLTALHKASGGAKRHQPALFLRNDETQAMIAALEKEQSDENCHYTNMYSDEKSKTYITINGGDNRGTYVCRELVYRYAMWISPDFSLKIIRAFDALTTTDKALIPAESPDALSNIAKREPLRSCVAAVVAQTGLEYPQVCRMVHTRFGVQHFDELRNGQVERAIEYLHGLIVMAAPKVAALPMSDGEAEPALPTSEAPRMNHTEMKSISRLIHELSDNFPFSNSQILPENLIFSFPRIRIA